MHLEHMLKLQRLVRSFDEKNLQEYLETIALNLRIQKISRYYAF